MFVFLAVSKEGDVCISILHEPGEDKYGYEKPEERWLPIHTVESILLSVISMIADPNDESPANVDAAVCILLFLVKFYQQDTQFVCTSLKNRMRMQFMFMDHHWPNKI